MSTLLSYRHSERARRTHLETLNRFRIANDIRQELWAIDCRFQKQMYELNAQQIPQEAYIRPCMEMEYSASKGLYVTCLSRAQAYQGIS